jgi:hypothetical protein
MRKRIDNAAWRRMHQEAMHRVPVAVPEKWRAEVEAAQARIAAAVAEGIAKAAASVRDEAK